MTKMVRCENHGVIALLPESSFNILKECKTPEEALARGVKWFVFITWHRGQHSPVLLGKVTARTRDAAPLLGYPHIALDQIRDVGDEKFFVPLSNGPPCWESDAKFVGTWAQFLQVIVDPSSIL